MGFLGNVGDIQAGTAGLNGGNLGKMRVLGFEPKTYGLKGRCSTS